MVIYCRSADRHNLVGGMNVISPSPATLCEERVPLGVRRVPGPGFVREGHGADVDACGVLDAKDSAPCGADHRPDLWVQHLEGRALDAEAYCDGRACIHAHLHVWWRLTDDADLGTAH